MSKSAFVILMFFFICIFGKAIDPEKKQLFQKAGYDLPLMPDKTLETLDYIEKNFVLDTDEKEKLDYLKIKSLFCQNNLNEALKKIADKDENLSTNIVILKRNILGYLSIQTLSFTKKYESNNDIIFSEQIKNLTDKVNQNKIKNISGPLSAILKKATTCNLLLARENLLLLFESAGLKDFKSSDYFLKEIQKLYNNDVEFQIFYGHFLIENNKLDEAKALIGSLPKESLEQTANINLKYEYYDLLVDYYSKTGSYGNYKEYSDKTESILKLLDQAKFSAKNKWFNIVENNYKDEEKSLLESRKSILFYIIAAGSIIIILILIRFLQISTQIKEYRNFISKINILKEKKTSQPQTIPEKTESLLLEKLQNFEKSEDCIDPNISLQNLAKKLETNTKYLSEAINTHKQKNFNAYINELRINYIINKLKEKSIYRSYKIKYLAEESGFSTHSAFTAVFKSVTGMSPASYIQLLKEKEV